MAKLIDGKVISTQIKEEIKAKMEQMKAEGKEVTLAVIQVGSDPASSVYVNNKHKACEYVGIRSLVYQLPEETTEEKLLELIKELNERNDVHGILVQLPLLEIKLKAPTRSSAKLACNKWSNKAQNIFETLYDNLIDN